MSRAPALLLLSSLALTACTGSSSSGGAASAGSSSSERSEAVAAQLTAPSGVTVVPGATGPELATAASQALYDTAPLVVLAGAGDGPAQARAASFAVAVGAPMLLAPAAGAPAPGAGSTGEELDRLGAGTVLAFGADARSWADGLDDGPEVVPAPADAGALQALAQDRLGEQRPTAPSAVRRAVAELPLDGATPMLELEGAPTTPAGAADAAADDAELPELAAPARTDGAVVLAPAAVADGLAAVATARAAGADVHVLSEPDLRASPDVTAALEAEPDAPVLALGDAFGTAEQLQHDVEVARTGATLPAGGQLVLPGKLYVALYGHPGSDALGVLGEQGVDATIARAQSLARDYEAAGSDVPVVPTLEIITTVASAALGDGDYSAESTLDHVRPLVEAAGRAGVYVVLDLQPGYDDFLTQAKQYEQLLRLPHVGLALDPEWRLKPGQRHFGQIGSVSADEVNTVVTWLADLTREQQLPQKMLLLHQFKTYMLEDRERIDTSRRELSVVTQMDGLGSQAAKMDTWNVLRPGSPAGMRWGWKNFYDEDIPTLTPAQTLALTPTPVFVSYQ